MAHDLGWDPSDSTKSKPEQAHHHRSVIRDEPGPLAHSGQLNAILTKVRDTNLEPSRTTVEDSLSTDFILDDLGSISDSRYFISD
ncbi:hypothetical protein HanLR1_Chr03g0081901 [Helianthus annuus]|nr:hypothetical protein HanHA89_Chr03g0088721 [Helianthus annuus]KAJ0766815.1 hypothetical protein HanLR1_Chr03g0081901 [Helianthus annuus]